MAEDAFGYETFDPMASGNGRKNILIVDDINDQGTTINWILNDWQNSCFPNDERWKDEIWNYNVRFAVLFDNLASKANIKVDYIGEEINKAENNVWIDFPFEDWWLK
jgi:hypoxanthine-guanine phosphoribosyltransferase